MSLRKINSLEVNKQIGHLPDNIYGYNYGHYFSSISQNDENDFSKLLVAKRNLGESERRLFFEVRKYNSTDVRLVGYISDETQLIYSSKGLTENETVLFPREYKEYKNLVEIQLINQPLKISDRNIELDDLGYLTILELSKLQPKDDSAKTKNVAPQISPQVEQVDVSSTYTKASASDIEMPWYQKPLGQIFIGLFTLIIGGGILYHLGWN